ncbi:MAG TPA: hypothetical protein VGE74_23815 [Gemmata sp.]
MKGSRYHARTADVLNALGFRVCFVGGTPIQGEHGAKPIEQFKSYEEHGDDCDLAAVSADEGAGWSQYWVWMRACWQGRVAEVLVELDRWQARLGEPPPGEVVTAEERTDPRRVVAQARSYLGNNRDRMDYPRYRRNGLPTTSSLVESLEGEVNARVKSTQKHWDRPGGAESILQPRAALLSQDERLPRFFTERPGCPFRKRETCCRKPEEVTAQTVAWPLKSQGIVGVAGRFAGIAGRTKRAAAVVVPPELVPHLLLLRQEPLRAGRAKVSLLLHPATWRS